MKKVWLILIAVLLTRCAPVLNPKKPCQILKERCRLGKPVRVEWVCGYVDYMIEADNQQGCAETLPDPKPPPP